VSTSGGSSGGGVSSFNTRTGAVVYDLADAETVYTAAGELLAGSGPGAGDLLGIGTAGQVLTVGGADPSGLEWATPSGGSLTSVESYIGADVSLTASTIVNIMSVSLATGTWLIQARVYGYGTNVTAGSLEAWIGPTSASTTGAYASGGMFIGSAASGVQAGEVAITKVVTLAVTTTVYLIGKCNQAITAKATTDLYALPNCTGITAVKIG